MKKIILFAIAIAIIASGIIFFKTYRPAPKKTSAPVVNQIKSPPKINAEPSAIVPTAPKSQANIESSLDAELAGLDADISDIGQYNQDASLDTMNSDISAVSQ